MIDLEIELIGNVIKEGIYDLNLSGGVGVKIDLDF